MSEPSSFRASPDGIPEILKAPGAILDYSLDWLSDGWLDVGEQIATAAWDLPIDLTQQGTSFANGVATVWVGGGVVGADYTVAGTITTNQGRTDTRSFRLLCRAR